MKDLIQVLELNKINKVDQRMSRNEEGTLYESRSTEAAIPYHDACRNCKVVGGCNDLDPLCDLTMVHGIRSTGEVITRLLGTPKWQKRKAERDAILATE